MCETISKVCVSVGLCRGAACAELQSLSHSQSTGSSSVFPSNHTDQTTGGTTKSMSVHPAPPPPHTACSTFCPLPLPRLACCSLFPSAPPEGASEHPSLGSLFFLCGSLLSQSKSPCPPRHSLPSPLQAPTSSVLPLAHLAPAAPPVLTHTFP